MSKPVQIKIFFGMMMLTKRTYLILQCGTFVILIGIWTAYKTVFGPSTWLGTILTTEAPWFYDVLPWVLGIGVVLEVVELIVVLRKFREREEFLRRERLESQNSVLDEL
jgi:thiol:disulfide interchange protein